MKKGRRGKIALGRAAVEIAGGCLAGDIKTGVSWSYWVKRWYTFTPGEQSHVLNNEMLPLLVKTREVGPERTVVSAATCEPPVHDEQEMHQPTPEETSANLMGLKAAGMDPDLIDRLTEKYVKRLRH